MTSKLLEKLSPPGELEDLDEAFASGEDDVLPAKMSFNGRLVISESEVCRSSKGEVFYEEDDESSDTEDSGFPSDSICRGKSIASFQDLKKKIKFEVISTRISEEGGRKHVLYTVAAMKTEELDIDKAVVERRYSDFTKLYKTLRKSFPSIMAKFQFPSKVLGSRNFNRGVIEDRIRVFEKFLQGLSSYEEICKTVAFKDFFYLPDLKQACSNIRGGKFADSLRQLLNALHLQQKLGDGHKEIVATLGSITVVHNALDNCKEAELYATEALELIGHDMSSAYLIPLLSTCADLRWRMGMDKKKLEKRLIEVQRCNGIEVDHAFTLRELAVTRYNEID